MARKKRRGRPETREREMPPPRSVNEVGPTPETDLKALRERDWFPKLSVEHQGAALGINAGWHLLCQGLPAKASSPHRIGGKLIESPAVEQRKQAIEAAYRDWCGEMGRRGLHVRPVLQVVSEGLQPHEVDIWHRRYSGWGAETLLEALSLYVKVAPMVAVAMLGRKAA